MVFHGERFFPPTSWIWICPAMNVQPSTSHDANFFCNPYFWSTPVPLNHCFRPTKNFLQCFFSKTIFFWNVFFRMKKSRNDSWTKQFSLNSLLIFQVSGWFSHGLVCFWKSPRGQFIFGTLFCGFLILGEDFLVMSALFSTVSPFLSSQLCDDPAWVLLFPNLMPPTEISKVDALAFLVFLLLNRWNLQPHHALRVKLDVWKVSGFRF